MPDQSDIEIAIATILSDTLYPNGTASPSALGVLCRVYRGYPIATALDNDLAAGIVNITVTPVDDSYRATTRYLPQFVNTPAAPTLTASVAGTTVAFAGTADAGQLAGILVDAASYVYRTAPGDTPALVAAALAALVRNDRPATLAGATVDVPGAIRLVSRTNADAADTLELRRQQQQFRVTIWAPAAALRDAAAALLDATLAAIPFLDADGEACRLTGHGTDSSDKAQSASLYRRDLLYCVEYPTTATAARPAMLFGTATDNGIPTLA